MRIRSIPWPHRTLDRCQASYSDEKVAAEGCKKILDKFHITPDIEAEVTFRESLFNQLAGPTLLLHYTVSEGRISEVCGPLTSALGLLIDTRSSPSIEGTGGIYPKLSNEADGTNTEKIYDLTTRHVVLPYHNIKNINPMENEVLKKVILPDKELSRQFSNLFRPRHGSRRS